MTDKELIINAAREAGIIGPYIDTVYDGVGIDVAFKDEVWNPLRNDKDAFRLAIDFGMLIDICYADARVCVVGAPGHCVMPLGDTSNKNTQYELIRRCIVIVAAGATEAENAKNN